MFHKILVFFITITFTLLYGKEIPVSNVKELNEAIVKAEPGDIIVMKNGTWTDVIINFSSKANSTGPIIISAETPGTVILNGNSKLIFSSEYLIATGLYFKDGALTGSNNADAEKVVLFNSNNCRLTNSVIENYNPKNNSIYYYWIFFSGNYNRVDKCTFIGKNHAGPLICNDYSKLPNGKDSKKNIVDHCCFKNIPFDKSLDKNIFCIYGFGYNEEYTSDGAYFAIENNLFEHANGSDGEIISLRSNYNIVRNNTIRESKGAVVSRNGNFNTITGNFILGNNEQGTYGVRVSGRSIQVNNNYIYGLAGDGLILMTGEYIDKSLTKDYTPLLRANTPQGRVPRYAWVRNGMFGNNTFINIEGKDIIIGEGYKEGWPFNQMILLPENCTFINNVIQKAKQGIAVAVQASEKKLTPKSLKFQPQKFTSNIVFRGDIQIKPVPDGIKIADPLLKLAEDGLYRPLPGSPVIGAGIEPFVDDDIDGQPRKFHSDIGADEISPAPIARKPLTTKLVGASWLRE